jgi:exodeoxyribonuclease VII small subunit
LTLRRPACKASPFAENAVTTRKAKAIDFEQSLAELEAVVERLEHGELPLEDALRQFERGIELARSCQSALKQAEQKVEILLQKTPDATPETFDADE